MVETYISLAKRKEYSNHTETFSQDFLEEVAFKLSLEREYSGVSNLKEAEGRSGQRPFGLEAAQLLPVDHCG